MDNGNSRPILRYTLESVSENSPLSQVLVETAGAEVTKYLYGLDLLGRVRDSTTTYYGYDALNLRLHLDGNGEIAAQYRYGPFGEITGAGPDGYGYSGEAWDSEVRLLYLRTRYYQPEVGRFASRDLLAGVPEQPKTLHLYTYVVNDPIDFSDPSGLMPPLPPHDIVTYEDLRSRALLSAGWHFQTSALTKEEFATLIVAIVFGEHPGGKKQPLEDWQAVVSAILGPCGIPIPRTSYSIGNNSFGMANLRPSSVIEMLEGRIPGLEPGTYEPVGLYFNPPGAFVSMPGRAKALTAMMQGIESAIASGSLRFDHVLEYRVLYATYWFQRNIAISEELQNDYMAIEYLAANLERGAIRAKKLLNEPTWDRLAVWHNGGGTQDWEIVETGKAWYIDYIASYWKSAAKLVFGYEAPLPRRSYPSK